MAYSVAREQLTVEQASDLFRATDKLTTRYDQDENWHPIRRPFQTAFDRPCNSRTSSLFVPHHRQIDDAI